MLKRFKYVCSETIAIALEHPSLEKCPPVSISFAKSHPKVPSVLGSQSAHLSLHLLVLDFHLV